jgi:hypothetical protein
VGVAGYCVSAVPYTRNLMLVYRKRRMEREAAENALSTNEHE